MAKYYKEMMTPEEICQHLSYCIHELDYDGGNPQTVNEVHIRLRKVASKLAEQIDYHDGFLR